ncbi:MauE/DoxX family redox-associated membrane protein [Chitinophaga niabensis]|uniref:Methylamine utilisation protein MauE domain-containing protein n=1 Tax=Chitinophaga niabensis TaxID=536979 RepID=A0A1N6D586_9BACT|nr:MauE/DoxX family redox-associated membrane protein [Chitinophaga niabensis]SIN65814.1 hypothetical protein SAMN04488055_0271 [Chitinophaga niabensis]
MKKSTVLEIIVSLLVMLFLYASVSKLLDLEESREQMSKSPFITGYANFLALMVPVSEIVISVLLLIKRTRIIGLYASFCIMLAFTIYIYMMLHYSSYLPCSCGGVLALMSWEQHFWFNVVFVLIALAGILIHSRGERHVEAAKA